jgi:predicted HTH domain antitoxin
MKADGNTKRSLFKYRLFILEDYHMQISDERKKRVIDLYFNQHKTYAEIAEIEKMSPRDIHAIIKEEQARRQKYKDQQQQEEISAKAYKLFSKGKRPVQVRYHIKPRTARGNQSIRRVLETKASAYTQFHMQRQMAN